MSTKYLCLASVLALSVFAVSCGGEVNVKDQCTSTDTTTCGVGACQVTVPNCADGKAQTCTPGTPTTEVCNGIDDDCDGVVDNGLDTSQTCGVGACFRTVTECQNGQTQTCTPGTPTTELCNGIDDDCDGVVDNGATHGTCGVGACMVTVTCEVLEASGCTPGTPTAEVCDGIDNDCNGVVDDGLGSTTCGVGACQVTTNNCVNGAAATCTPGNPTTETCDGIDNDCDGVIDNSPPATAFTPIALQGFNADIVAEATPGTSTTNFDLGSGYDCYSQSYATEVGSGTGLPDTGVIVNGTRTYQLADYTTQNVLEIGGTAQSLDLVTPQHVSTLSLLGFSVRGATTFDVKLVFDDSTIENHFFMVMPDWFADAPAQLKGFGRTLVASDQPDTTTTEPSLYNIDIDLAGGVCNNTHKLTGFTVTNTTSGAYTIIFGASAGN